MTPSGHCRAGGEKVFFHLGTLAAVCKKEKKKKVLRGKEKQMSARAASAFPHNLPDIRLSVRGKKSLKKSVILSKNA